MDTIGKVEFGEKFHDIDTRITRYDILDYLNNCTNMVRAMADSDKRNVLIDELKRIKELVNNL
jgi:hypothetical protein